MDRTQAFGTGRWSGLFEICRHSAVIPVDSRKDLIFSQLRRSAVSVTWRSFFVESHEEKLHREAVRVRRRCPVFLWEFSSPAMGRPSRSASERKAFPHLSAVHLRKSSFVLPDSQSRQAPAS